MLSIDLKHAFRGGSDHDNFTVLLLRLIAKADEDNRELLRRGFPVQVKAVEIYRNRCPYRGEERAVDWDTLEAMAYAEVGSAGHTGE